MAVDRNLSIRLSVEEADRVKRALEDLSGAARRMKSDVEGATSSAATGGKLTDQLKGLKGELDGLVSGAGKIAGIAAGVAAAYSAFTRLKEAIAAAGDEVRSTTAKVNLATEGLMGGAQSFGEVARIAQAVGAPLEATASLFARIGRSAADAGVTSVQQVARATEIVQKLGIASGASTQEASAAALQLGQALASGRLQGDELRSVMENMPPLARAIAKEFGVSVGQLRDMGAAGELVGDRVLKGILSAGQDADRQFALLPKTVERASQEMATSWTLFLGKLDETLGVSKGIVASLQQMKGVVDATGSLIAPSLETKLADARARLASPPSPDGSRVVDTGGFGPALVRNQGPAYASRDEQRTAILKEILDLENQIGAAAVAADADDQRRFQEQQARLKERLAGLDAENAKALAAAQFRSNLSKQELAELDARQKAETEIRARLSGIPAAEQERAIRQAGERAVAELRLKNAQEDRWKAEADAARAAEKAQSDAARQAEKNAADSKRRLDEEEDSRRRGLETVDDQITKLEEEAKAIALSERARAIANETLKAEITLRKAGVAADQDMLESQLRRVADAAGSNFDAKSAAKEREKLAAEAARAAERQAEEAERPYRNLFDNLQRGAAEMFDSWMSGTAKFGDTVIKVIRRAAAEFVSASVITPFFQDLGTQLGIGGKKYDANVKGTSSSGGGFSLPSFGGGGFLDGITNRIDALGNSILGTAAPSAVGGWTVTGVGGPTASALNAGAGAGTLSSYLPYVGAGIGVLTNLASGNYAGAGLTAAGAAIGSIIPGVGTAVGAAVGGVLGSFFGGKKPSVGPGGGIGFGVGSDGD